MALQDEIRADLEAEVFDEFGKTVTLINETSPQYNNRGELEDYTESTSSITAVPYDITWDRKSSQEFGELQEGDIAIAIPYTITVIKGNKIEIDGERFEVVEISKNFLPDNVVTICQLRRIQSVTADD